MPIAGIDYSMTCPSICVFTGNRGDPFCFDACVFYFLTDTKKYATKYMENIYGSLHFDYDITKDGEFPRYEDLSDWAMEKLTTNKCTEVGLEGYSFGSKGRVFHIAENTGILKYKLYQKRLPLDIIPPTTVKKEATGTGNADKRIMHDAFTIETGHDLQKFITPMKKEVTSPVSDIVDSFYVCKCLYKRMWYDRLED